MSDSDTTPAVTPPPEPAQSGPPLSGDGKQQWPWIELVKVLALPLVTLVLGYWFNASLTRQVATTSLSEMMAP